MKLTKRAKRRILRILRDNANPYVRKLYQQYAEKSK